MNAARPALNAWSPVSSRWLDIDGSAAGEVASFLMIDSALTVGPSASEGLVGLARIFPPADASSELNHTV